MNLFKVILNHKLLAFLVGTVLLQAGVFGTAAFFHSDYWQRSSTADAASIEQSDLDHGNSLTAEKIVNADAGVSAPKGPKQITYKIASGDTLTKIWVKNGANSNGALSAAEAFKKAGVPLSTIRLDDEIQLTISEDGDIIEFRKKVNEEKTIVLKGDSVSGYNPEVLQAPIFEKERTVTYSISNSFAASAREVSVPNDVINDLVDLFSGRIDFRRDIQPDDTFTVIYDEKVTEDGVVVGTGSIKAVSIENNGKLLAAIRHVGKDSKAAYFDENGQVIGNYFLRYPLQYTRISSVFSKGRFHPVLKVSRPHNGVDFAAPVGTPVRSVAEGVVEFAGSAGGSGIMLKIRHCDRYTTAYLHLSRISAGVRKGSRVSRGQVIGAVGMTGLATGPHLHFALYDNDRFIDPLKAKMPTLSSNGQQIPRTILASTMQTLKQQHEIIRFASLVGLKRESRV